MGVSCNFPLNQSIEVCKRPRLAAVYRKGMLWLIPNGKWITWSRVTYVQHVLQHNTMHWSLGWCFQRLMAWQEFSRNLSGRYQSNQLHSLRLRRETLVFATLNLHRSKIGRFIYLTGYSSSNNIPELVVTVSIIRFWYLIGVPMRPNLEHQNVKQNAQTVWYPKP